MGCVSCFLVALYLFTFHVRGIGGLLLALWPLLLHCPCVLFPPRQLRLPQRFALIITYLGLGGSGLLLTYYLGLGGSVPLAYYLPYGLYFRRDGSDVRRLAYYAPLLCLQHPDVPRSCCLV